VAFHGGTFFHLPKIGFDYRVRSDSMIVKTIGFDYRMQRDPSNVVRISPRLDEVVNYYFRQAGIGLLQATAWNRRGSTAAERRNPDHPKFTKLSFRTRITCPGATAAKTVARCLL